ncbi:MAG: rhamnulokinase [Lachnospiraceae bacterium]|nr:rhamnulokinase [Lachnospiraceae bacterium]
MPKYYLAIDIGASGGRHILGYMEKGRLKLEEVYRFPNGMVEQDGQLVWNTDQLFIEILRGMKRCKDLGKIPESVGIDTWAVDFCLLDGQGRRLGEAVAYRDARTQGMDRLVYDYISEEDLYARTGIQKQPFNTIYQLMAVKKQCPEMLERAEKLLLIPDYLHYLLTGRCTTEYTNATTTQLINPQTKDWDWELIDRLEYPRKIFLPLIQPGTNIGKLTEDVSRQVGYECQVVVPATHDTASAVMAVPAEDDFAMYISSGTWSLMGTELEQADCSMESRLHNLTNEGGYDYRYRYLKNIMGLWMIQSVRKELNRDLDYDTICHMAMKCSIESTVDCNDSRFLSPENMTDEIQAACREQGLQVPIGIGQMAAVIYRSLAKCYRDTLHEIEQLTGRTYRCIHVVGGGSNADFLNRLTAREAGIPVLAGPGEATAIGNLCAQMIGGGELADLAAARECIRESFALEKFLP